MRSTTHTFRTGSGGSQQRGVVLFFTLVALLVMSLAAVALIRSVDTSTMIAGNLAFKQATTSSADAGIETAMEWLDLQSTGSAGLNVIIDTTHPFNSDDTANGYYSSVDPALDLTDAADFDWETDAIVAPDVDGNEIRYVIHRMCRVANQLPREDICLFSTAAEDQNGQDIPLPQHICTGDTCPDQGQSPLMRITARALGPRSSVSYVQAFVF